MKRRTLLALLALSCAGCSADVVGGIDALKLDQVLKSSYILEAIARGVGMGKVLAGLAALVLPFMLWYETFVQKRPAMGMVKEALIGAGLCVWMLKWAGSPWGLERWIFEAGGYLGQTFSLPEGVLAHLFVASQERLQEQTLEILKADVSLATLGGRIVQAVAYHLAMPTVAAVLVANAMGMWLIRTLAHISFTFLMGMYWMLFPFVVWTLILRQTRSVFYAFLRSYLTVAMVWPLLFAFADRLMVAMNLVAWPGLGASSSGPIETVNELLQAHVMFFLLNLTFLGMYVAVPVAAHRLVSGASEPFRGARH